VHLLFDNVEIDDWLTLSHVPWQPELKTDAEGRWQYEGAPGNVDGLSVRLEHPDYLSDSMYGSIRYRSGQAIESLRDGSSLVVMKKGGRMGGRVVDGSGNPVPNAEVKMGRDRWGTHEPSVRTAADGTYVIENGKIQDRLYFTVEAEGFAPDLKVVETAGPEAELTVDFELAPAKRLKVRLVDEAGDPVKGVLAVADGWRGARTLDFRVTSDAQGRFVWMNAPGDEVLFDIMKGDTYLRRFPITAGDGEVTVPFVPALRVSGTVVDAETGDAIPEFRVTMGRKTEPNDSSIYWKDNSARNFSGGTFERKESFCSFLYYYRIEAEGYAPFETEPIVAAAQKAAVEVRLRPRVAGR
jgi:hypothetical protein